MEAKAYKKGLRVISTCETTKHITGAYNYIHNFRLMFGKTDYWKELYRYCGQRRDWIGEK